MSQTDLAAKLDVRKATVSDWLRKEKLPDSDYLLRLPGVLGVSADWLLTGREFLPTAAELPQVEPTTELHRRIDEILHGDRPDMDKSSLLIDLALVLRAEALRERGAAARLEAEAARTEAESAARRQAAVSALVTAPVDGTESAEARRWRQMDEVIAMGKRLEERIAALSPPAKAAGGS